MKNVQIATRDNHLLIDVDLSLDFGESGSGKSIVIATTEGSVTAPDTDGVRVGLNVYLPKKGRAAG
jgi:hypothetical protein